MLIKEAQPPVAVASTTTPMIAAGGTVTLDGSGSHDQDENGVSIVEWIWKFDNTTDPGTDFTVMSADPVLQYPIPIAGEYVVTLTVKDNEGELSDNGSSSDAAVTLKAVAVTFRPDPVVVAVSAVETVTAEVIPLSAAPLVTFTLSAPKATLDKQSATQSPEIIKVTGVETGTARLEAIVTTSNGSATCGGTDVTVTSGYTARISGPNPHTLVSDGSGVISIGDMSLPSGSQP
jgi:hypothetical protein